MVQYNRNRNSNEILHKNMLHAKDTKADRTYIRQGNGRNATECTESGPLTPAGPSQGLNIREGT